MNKKTKEDPTRPITFGDVVKYVKEQALKQVLEELKKKGFEAKDESSLKVLFCMSIHEVGEYIKHLRRELANMDAQLQDARRVGKLAHERFKTDMMNALYEIEKKHG